MPLQGSCIQTLLRPLATDTGAYSINPADLQHISGAASTCPITATLLRSGTVQRALEPGTEGGWFYARTVQRRVVEVSWEP